MIYKFDLPGLFYFYGLPEVGMHYSEVIIIIIEIIIVTCH